MKRTVLIAVLAVALVFGVVAYANAAGATVTVGATVNNKLELTIVDGDEAATLSGLPGDGVKTDTSSMVVRSNTPYNVTRVGTGALAAVYGAAFSVSGATGTNFPKAPGSGGATHTDTYSLDFGNGTTDPWLDAGTVSETFTYSVVPF